MKNADPNVFNPFSIQRKLEVVIGTGQDSRESGAVKFGRMPNEFVDENGHKPADEQCGNR